MQKELAYRENDGVTVALLWHSGTNALTVSVLDRRTDDAFELEVVSPPGGGTRILATVPLVEVREAVPQEAG